MGARIAELSAVTVLVNRWVMKDLCQQQEGSHLHSAQSGPGAHSLGTDGAFAGSKVVSAWNWPLTSVEYHG